MTLSDKIVECDGVVVANLENPNPHPPMSEILWVKDVKQAVKELKEKIDKMFDEFQKNWGKTNIPEVAQLRFAVSVLILGNDGILDKINDIFGGELC